MRLMTRPVVMDMGGNKVLGCIQSFAASIRLAEAEVNHDIYSNEADLHLDAIRLSYLQAAQASSKQGVAAAFLARNCKTPSPACIQQ